MFDQLLLRMFEMAGLREPGTRGHAKRVAEISLLILDATTTRLGWNMQEDEGFLRGVCWGGLLHDIGKISIPADTVLLKPTALDPHERLILQSHAVAGANLFRDERSRLERVLYPQQGHIGRVQSVLLDVALHHHEHWDGNGYPGDVRPGESSSPLPAGVAKGLRGTQLPLAARIVGVAEVYDTLVSRQCYKDPWPPVDAQQEIRDLFGRWFDPDVVDDFFTALPDIERVDPDPDLAAILEHGRTELET